MFLVAGNNLEKDILNFIDSYITAQSTENYQRANQLEEEGKDKTASYTDLAKAITNLTMGVSKQLDDIEESYNMNLNILIDALRQADMINDDVIDFIQEKLEEIDKEEEENE
ncbi:hypothetical protein 110_00060 [Staphylococcus phage 110]|uniref:Phage protein n=3 Tax=unclassified Sepunavirus TaxID=2315193 RepID=A0AAX3Y531_9CAUD|nr:hypothetical protein 110_00061 [Staphylococcus phage 110]